MSKSIIKQKRILTKASGGSSLATPVSIANGGTGLSSYAVGDILYASGTTTLSKLPIGTASQQLRVNAGATALEYFTPTGSGITVGTTTITGGTTGSIGMNIGGIYSESISYRAQQATPFSTAFGFESHSSGSFSGINNSSFGYQAGKAITTGTNNAFFGYNAGLLNSTGADNVYIGSNAGKATTNLTKNIVIGSNAAPVSNTLSESVMIGYNSCIVMTSGGLQSVGVGAYTYDGGSSGSSYSVAVGYDAIGGEGANSYCTAVGHSSGNSFRFASYCTTLGYNSNSVNNSAYSSSIAIGANAKFTANNQGVLGANNANGYVSDWYFNGVTHTSAYSVVLNASGGSGSNNAGANLTLAAGKSTGSATPAVINFQSTATGASSSTAQTLATVLQITNSTTITTSDAVNYTLGSTTGTKFGTANTQKLAFWGVTPVTQYATTGTTTGFTANASANTLFNESTFTGDTGATAYTISDLVKALKLCGIILA